MIDATFHNRIKEIYRMLFELSTGNISYRLPAQDAPDELSRLVHALNAFAAQLQLAIKKSGYVVPYYSYQNLTHWILVLDTDLSIKAFSSKLPELLACDYKEFGNADFQDLLTEDSKGLWNARIMNQVEDLEFQESLHLHFRSTDDQILTALCTVSRIRASESIIVSAISTQIDEAAQINQSAAQAAKRSDAAVVQDLYEYIMNNLERPLPTIKELSARFQTNEFKLKEGFRHFFKTSIYKFYNSERLKRAHILIEQTELSLKVVAMSTGFNDYVTFSKAFKKFYGYAPGKIVRPR